jgi:anti-sigma-K factor RskA
MSETPTPPSRTSTPAAAGPQPADDDRVPLFGTWRTIHAAVVACALAVMALVALFSRWRF